MLRITRGLAFIIGVLLIQHSIIVTASVSNEKELSLKKGQLLSIAAPINRQDGKQWVKEYSRRAFPLAASFGMQRGLNLKVLSSLQKGESPKQLGFFVWPDRASAKALSEHADWPEILSLRPKAWDELKIYTSELAEDVTLKFSADKYYTMAIVWFSQEHPTGYDQYMAGIRDKVHQVGGKFMLKMRSPEYESIQDAKPSPGQLTLVEWPSREALSALFSSPIYEANKVNLTKGASAIEFYGLSI